ncbi:MAG: NAD-dependent epimerase/dehydratase family protein [Bacteroidota bacterium]
MSEKIEILVIGGNSFVAKSFVNYNKINCNITLVSRTKSQNTNVIVVEDYNTISDEVFKNKNVVINCTAIVHQKTKIEDSIYFDVNHKLAIKLANQAKQNGVKQFIQFSTIAVYGNVEEINNTTKEKPINAYGKSKLLADIDLKKLISETFAVTIFRAPLIYGGENPPGNMLRLVKLVEKGFPLPFGNANGTRDFINIKNLVQYIENVITENKSGLFLVTDNTAISTKDLVKSIAKILNKKITLLPLPRLVLSVLKKLKPEIFDKLFGTLKIEPSKNLSISTNHTIESGLEDMIQYYLKNKNS